MIAVHKNKAVPKIKQPSITKSKTTSQSELSKNGKEGQEFPCQFCDLTFSIKTDVRDHVLKRHIPNGICFIYMGFIDQIKKI